MDTHPVVYKNGNVKYYLIQKETNKTAPESGEQILKNDMELIKDMYFITQDIKHIPSMINKRSFKSRHIREKLQNTLWVFKKIRRNRVEFQRQENKTYLRLYHTSPQTV